MKINIKEYLPILCEAFLLEPEEIMFAVDNYSVEQLPTSPEISLVITTNKKMDFLNVLKAGHISLLHRLLLDRSNNLMFEIEDLSDIVFETDKIIKSTKVETHTNPEHYLLKYNFECQDSENMYAGVNIQIKVFPEKIIITYDIGSGSDKNIVESLIKVYTSAVIMFFANRQHNLEYVKTLVYSQLNVTELPEHKKRLLEKNILIFLAKNFSNYPLIEDIEVVGPNFFESPEFADFNDNIEAVVPKKLLSLHIEDIEEDYFTSDKITKEEILQALEGNPEALEKLLKLFDEEDILNFEEYEQLEDDIIELEEEDDFADWREIEDDEYLDDEYDDDYYEDLDI